MTYSFDDSSLIALSDASKALFTNLAFRGITGPNALNGIITSKILPSLYDQHARRRRTSHTAASSCSSAVRLLALAAP